MSWRSQAEEAYEQGGIEAVAALFGDRPAEDYKRLAVQRDTVGDMLVRRQTDWTPDEAEALEGVLDFVDAVIGGRH